MSASDPNSAIYVTDSAKDIKSKVNKFAFFGGQESIEKHRELGANLKVDIPYKYLGFFLDDDNELEHIGKEYGAGRMLTGEVKQRLIEVFTEIVERHRKARAAVTDEMVDAFMEVGWTMYYSQTLDEVPSCLVIPLQSVGLDKELSFLMDLG